MQSEAALRHLASAYSYDSFDDDDNDKSLRANMDEVSQALMAELDERVSKAGVVIEEGRLSHLAYAPEIASAMLQRQQADAIVAARTRIVDGAIGMVEMALKRLDEDGAVDLDEERKASMGEQSAGRPLRRQGRAAGHQRGIPLHLAALRPIGAIRR